MKVGIFEIPERVIFPSTHKELQRQLRALAEGMGLTLKFVERTRLAYSYCDPIAERAVVIAKFRGHRYSRLETAFYTFHEISHWMDYNNGLFRGYYPRRGYKHIINPAADDLLRLGVRAEQHCDWLAHRILWNMYELIYDRPNAYDDAAAARRHIIEHYEIIEG